MLDSSLHVTPKKPFLTKRNNVRQFIFSADDKGKGGEK